MSRPDPAPSSTALLADPASSSTMHAASRETSFTAKLFSRKMNEKWTWVIIFIGLLIFYLNGLSFIGIWAWFEIFISFYQRIHVARPHAMAERLVWCIAFLLKIFGIESGIVRERISLGNYIFLFACALDHCAVLNFIARLEQFRLPVSIFSIVVLPHIIAGLMRLLYFVGTLCVRFRASFDFIKTTEQIVHQVYRYMWNPVIEAWDRTAGMIRFCLVLIVFVAFTYGSKSHTREIERRHLFESKTQRTKLIQGGDHDGFDAGDSLIREYAEVGEGKGSAGKRVARVLARFGKHRRRGILLYQGRKDASNSVLCYQKNGVRVADWCRDVDLRETNPVSPQSYPMVDEVLMGDLMYGHHCEINDHMEFDLRLVGTRTMEETLRSIHDSNGLLGGNYMNLVTYLNDTAISKPARESLRVYLSVVALSNAEKIRYTNETRRFRAMCILFRFIIYFVAVHCFQQVLHDSFSETTAWDFDTTEVGIRFHPTQYDMYVPAASQTTDRAKQILQEFQFKARRKQSGHSHLYQRNSSPALDRSQYYRSEGRRNLLYAIRFHPTQYDVYVPPAIDWLEAGSGECAEFGVNVLSTGHPYSNITTIQSNHQHEHETADLFGSAVDLFGSRARSKHSAAATNTAWDFDTKDLTGWSAMGNTVRFRPKQYDVYVPAASQTTHRAQFKARGKQSDLYQRNSSPALDRSNHYGREGRRNFFVKDQCCYKFDWLEAGSGECAEFGVNVLSTGHPYASVTTIQSNHQHEHETADLFGSAVDLYGPWGRSKLSAAGTNTAWDFDTKDLTGWSATRYAIRFYPSQYDVYVPAASQTTDRAKQILQEFQFKARRKQSGYYHLYQQNSSPALDRSQHFGSEAIRNLFVKDHPYASVTPIQSNHQQEHETADLFGSAVDLYCARARSKHSAALTNTAWDFDTKHLTDWSATRYAIRFNPTQYDVYVPAAFDCLEAGSGECAEFEVNVHCTGHPYSSITTIQSNHQHEHETADLLGSSLKLFGSRARRKYNAATTNTAWDFDTKDLTGLSAMGNTVRFHPTQYDVYVPAASQTTDRAQFKARGKQSNHSHLYQRNRSPALDRSQYYGSEGRRKLFVKDQCCYNFDWLEAGFGEFGVNVLSTGHPYASVPTIQSNHQQNHETAGFFGSAVDLYGSRARSKHSVATTNTAWDFDTKDLMDWSATGFAIRFHPTQNDGYVPAASQTPGWYYSYSRGGTLKIKQEPSKMYILPYFLCDELRRLLTGDPVFVGGGDTMSFVIDNADCYLTVHLGVI